jgi:hypothetical protein
MAGLLSSRDELIFTAEAGRGEGEDGGLWAANPENPGPAWYGGGAIEDAL